MPERTAPALSPEQLPAEFVPHYVEPGTVYDDEPGELVPPGWYVLGDHGHGEGADIEIKISRAVDADGRDITGPLAAKIASLLRAEPAAPRVPQPGDRVFGWSAPFGTVHGFVVADEHINAEGQIAVKAPAVATPYAVDPATVQVIEPARSSSETAPSSSTPPEPGASEERDIEPRLLDALRYLGAAYGPLGVALAAATLTDTDVLVHQLTHDAPEPHDEPAPATEQPSEWTAQACDVCEGPCKAPATHAPLRPADTEKETDR